MKYLFAVALIALAIHWATAAGSTASTEATSTTTTTTTTTTTAPTTTTTTAPSQDTTTTDKTHRKKLCWRGNDWCGTFVPKRKRCKNGKCRRVVVRVTRRKTA